MPSPVRTTDDTTDARAVHAYARGVAAVACAACGSKLFGNDPHIIQLFRATIAVWVEKNAFDKPAQTKVTPHAHACLKCGTCGQHACLGCGDTLSATSREHTATFGRSSLTWHCDSARLALIWIILCGYDKEAKHNQPRVPAPQVASHKRNRSTVPGVGYASDDSGSPSLPSLPSLSNLSFSSGSTHWTGSPSTPIHSSHHTMINETAPFFHQSHPHSIAWMGHGSHDLQTGPLSQPTSTAPVYWTPYGSCDVPLSSKHYPPYAPPPHTAPQPLTDLHGMAPPFHPTKKCFFKSPSSPSPQQHPIAPYHSMADAATPGETADSAFHVLDLAEFRPDAMPRVDPDDTLSTHTMTVLSLLLPSVDASYGGYPTPFDHTPPAVLSSMLLESSILNRVADLLRNENLDDIKERAALYRSLMAFTRMLANHRATARRTMYDYRTQSLQGQDLLNTSLRRRKCSAIEKKDRLDSIAYCLTNLHTQAELMLRSAKTDQAAFANEDGQHILSICHNIFQLGHLLRTRSRGHQQANNEDSNDTQQWHEAPDEAILGNHAFAREAKATTGSGMSRMRALFKDVNALKTSLPPGIFLRYASSRLDVMKILIIGPEGTPYENGAFEFDLFCVSDYPDSPPKMLFKTTGGGTARMNPNLYQDGKVCLSLLGTWEGEPWVPRQSTLLQLLISIQAMIFCDEPYCNEPGYGDEIGTEKSKEYNRKQYAMTVKHAMLDWLTGDSPKQRSPRYAMTAEEIVGWTVLNPHGQLLLRKGNETQNGSGGVWDAVIRKHFAANESKILTTVARWVDDKPEKQQPSRSMLGGPSLQTPPPPEEDTMNDKTLVREGAIEKDSRLITELKRALGQLISLEEAKANYPY